MPPGGFRTAYTSQGVSTYYTANSTTYRNPHYPGVIKCIHAILSDLLLPPPPHTNPSTHNTWHSTDVVIEKDTGDRYDLLKELEMGGGGLTVFDCAAGGGEATVSIRTWVERWAPGLLEYEGDKEGGDGGAGEGDEEDGEDGSGDGDGGRENGERKRKGKLTVYACDPFTYGLYEERVNGYRRQEGAAAGKETGGGEEGEPMEVARIQGKEEEGRRAGEETSRDTGQEAAQTASGKTGTNSCNDIPPTPSPAPAITPATPLSPNPPPTVSPSDNPGPTPHPKHRYIICHPFSFRDIPLEGLDTLLSLPSIETSTISVPESPKPPIDITIISFALHLCPPSELFSLLYELSRHSRYLVVVAPHKNPNIPGGGESGWIGPVMEVLVRMERVRGRVFRSVNY